MMPGLLKCAIPYPEAFFAYAKKCALAQTRNTRALGGEDKRIDPDRTSFQIDFGGVVGEMLTRHYLGLDPWDIPVKKPDRGWDLTYKHYFVDVKTSRGVRHLNIKGKTARAYFDGRIKTDIFVGVGGEYYFLGWIWATDAFNDEYKKMNKNGDGGYYYAIPADRLLPMDRMLQLRQKEFQGQGEGD